MILYFSTKEALKGLEMISHVDIAFGSSLTGALNMKANQISVQVQGGHHLAEKKQIIPSEI